MRLTTSVLIFLTCILFGCAYPRTIRVYDDECQVTARKMVLDVTAINSSGKCAQDDCVAQLVGEATVLATSTVISGSIVIAGNVVYWLEKKRNCNPKRVLPEPAAAVNQ